MDGPAHFPCPFPCIHIYVGPAGGRILSVYRRRPLRGQRLPPARLLLPLRRPRGHARCTQKNGPRAGAQVQTWGLEILIFGASRQPGKQGHIGILSTLCADWACEVRCCPPWLERMWPAPVATAEDPAGNQLHVCGPGLGQISAMGRHLPARD